ncbi:bacterioferritin [Aestuariibacter sp. AA17]|uniref:Bacterioferritin n=1 Tax=Fluctibacter corallii TaxID=2984329 RepID=A0ABT3A6H8_9ALTE|nr:bacterioferritin [Aestuariibacter sp. AA17]MCV2884203.1 bacterioferritin [Aestuariibacter sp. AA17]
MDGNKKVVSMLNEVLTAELTSINQYFLHARMFKNWGFSNLNEVCYKKSIKDMKQADDLIERILFLNGIPNLQALNKLYIGEEPVEMLECDLKFQLEQLPLLKKAIVLCENEKDFVTRELLEDILSYEEGHVDWLEAQQYQIDAITLENYLQSQIHEGDD